VRRLKILRRCRSSEVCTDDLQDYRASIKILRRNLEQFKSCCIVKQTHSQADTAENIVVADRLQAGRSSLHMSSLHSLAPSYLADELHQTAESEFQSHLCSALSYQLSVPHTQFSSYGDRAFPVAAVRIWNSLPQHITSALSLPVFCSRLKTYFFVLCYL